MKNLLKPAMVTGIFSVVVFIFCFVLGFFTPDAQYVLPPDKMSLILLTGQSYFMTLLPSVLVTGFLIGLAITFGGKTIGEQKGFSRQSIRNYQFILVYGVIFSLFAFCASEIGSLGYSQLIQNKKNRLKNYYEYLEFTEEHMRDGRLSLAQYYLKNAWQLYPKSPEVAILDRELESLLVTPEDMFIHEDKDSVVSVISVQTGDDREALSFLEAAQLAFDENRYVDAHYFATLAASAAQKDDANWVQATQIAAVSWNMLHVPEDSVVEEGASLFSDKLRGYDALTRDDIIEAYSIYYQLASDYEDDEEIATYFEIARNKLEGLFFYTDETDDLRTFESSQGVFFSLTNEDGTSSDYYISGITVVEDSSKMIQYLRNLSIINYDVYHNAVSSMVVPYAKMTAEPFTRGGKTRYEPFLTLVSVDRKDSYNRLNPIYSLNKNDEPVPTNLHLPMSYSDFNLICKASSGPAGLSIIQLHSFAQKAELYGYTGETYYTAFLHRILFPLDMLILMVMMGLSSFRYRMLPGRVFKFKWILLFPLFTVLLYPLMNVVLYFFDSINLVGYNCYGTAVFPIAVLVQMIVLVWVSFLFVSARGE